MSYKRHYPGNSPRHMADSRREFAKLFDTSQRVVVYWRVDSATVTVVGYYSTVSAANTAASAAVDAQGHYPKIAINWWHSTFTLLQVGPVQHPDARVDYPDWYDETPAY